LDYLKYLEKSKIFFLKKLFCSIFVSHLILNRNILAPIFRWGE